MRRATGRPTRRLGVACVALALLLGACRSQAPAEQFAAAFEATLADSFAFSITLEADQAALADLGEAAGGAAALLSGVELRGVVDGRDTELALDALGGQIIEIRQVEVDGEPVLYLRAGVVDLFRQVGVDEFDAERAVLAELSAQGAGEPVLDVVRDGFDGEWVGLEGGLGQSLSDAAGLGDPGADDAPVSTAFGADLRDFLDRYVEVTAFDDGILRAGLRLGDLLRAAAGVGENLPLGRDFEPEQLETDLAGLPEVVAGDVRVVGGRVEEFAFDVAQASRAFGRPIDGRIVVRVSLTDHGRAGPVRPPAGVVPLEAAVLDDAVAAILSSLGVG